MMVENLGNTLYGILQAEEDKKGNGFCKSANIWEELLLNVVWCVKMHSFARKFLHRVAGIVVFIHKSQSQPQPAISTLCVRASAAVYFAVLFIWGEPLPSALCPFVYVPLFRSAGWVIMLYSSRFGLTNFVLLPYGAMADIKQTNTAIFHYLFPPSNYYLRWLVACNPILLYCNLTFMPNMPLIFFQIYII